MKKKSVEPLFATIGKPTDTIVVRLSYRIVELFSEGLYASPNKAIEELVSNSFDAGATTVQVIYSPNLHAQNASIAVIDNGIGMGADGLRQHWLIGVSNKRHLSKLPAKRQQIGQFGIGKLATYVLADRLTHISKFEGKYYSTSMDYRSIDQRVEKEVEPVSPIKLDLRELTEAQAISAMKEWTEATVFKNSGMKLFGSGSPPTWTISIMSSLKDKVHEIKPGTLEWVLRTAMPLRDDFSIWLNGKKLKASKEGKGHVKKWLLGKDITDLAKPAPKDIALSEDKNEPAGSEQRYGLEVPGLGRVTGYAEIYKDLLTGKSDEIARSYGFFVYIFGRLINVEDGHFGIRPDELRHGTFGRFRLVINIDSLDKELRSNRETIRSGPMLTSAQNVLRSIFNFVRPHIERLDQEEEPGTKLARKIGASPASLSRTPIVELARAILSGKAKSRYIIVPRHRSKVESDAFIESLQERAEVADQFVTGLTIDHDGEPDAGLAQYETETGLIRINAWHPFVSTFYDDFTNKSSRQPLELLAMAEILAEAQLHSIGVKSELITEFLYTRDQLLRTLANESGRKSPFAVARSLREARNDENALEQQLCEAFTSLGCECRTLGKKGKPDGIAVAVLAADERGNPRQYRISLEAKSKKTDNGKVAASTVDIAAVIRHRAKHDCHHALVVGISFPTTQGEKSALAHDIEDDRKKTAALNAQKTITLITIDDLADLVRLRPIKQIGLLKLRELFDCRLPEDCHNWIDGLKKLNVKKPPYKRIVETIRALQLQFTQSMVKYDALRVKLADLVPPIPYETNDDLISICKAMAQMSDGTMYATSESVEIDQSIDNVLAAIDAATKEYEHDSNSK